MMDVKMVSRTDELRGELEAFMTQHNIDSGELDFLIRQMSRVDGDKKIREKVQQNEALDGKCFLLPNVQMNKMFPPMNRYGKVLSARSENEFRVECLVFDEHPVYWFDYHASKIGRPGDYYLGSFDFQAIWVESLMARDVERAEEISLHEFDSEFRRYTEELLQTKWYADHYRWGGVMPSDANWECKRRD